MSGESAELIIILTIHSSIKGRDGTGCEPEVRELIILTFAQILGIGISYSCQI